MSDLKEAEQKGNGGADSSTLKVTDKSQNAAQGSGNLSRASLSSPAAPAPAPAPAQPKRQWGSVSTPSAGERRNSLFLSGGNRGAALLNATPPDQGKAPLEKKVENSANQAGRRASAWKSASPQGGAQQQPAPVEKPAEKVAEKAVEKAVEKAIQKPAENTPVTPTTEELGLPMSKRLIRIQKDSVLGLAKKVKEFPAPPQREAYSAIGKSNFDKNRHGISRTQTFVEGANDILVGGAGDVADIVGASMSIGADKAKSFKDLLKDGGSEEIPFLGGILSAISAAVTFAGIVFKLIRGLATKSMTKSDWIDLAIDGMDVAFDAFNGGLNIAKDAGAAISGLPAVGAVFGAVSSFVQVCKSSYGFVKGILGLIDMKKQMNKRGNAQKGTKARDETGKILTTDDTLTKRNFLTRGKGALSRSKRVDDVNAEREDILTRKRFLINNDPQKPDAPVVPTPPGAKASSADKKAYKEKQKEYDAKKKQYDIDMRRYDEDLDMRKEMENTPKDELEAKFVQEEAAIQASKEMDMMYELRKANKNRIKRTGQEIAEQIVHFGASMATIDPTYGTAIGAGVNVLASGSMWAVKGTNKGRQVARNLGIAGTDTSKSSKGKKQRRHRLAIAMYDDLARVDSVGLMAADSGAKTQYTKAGKDELTGKMDKFYQVATRINAMDVHHGTLAKAPDADDFIKTLRKGFYRESR